jgi:exocyst complex component 5
VCVQEACAQQLEEMDQRMADNTASAIGIGERLTMASMQRDSVEAALEVMKYFEELNTGVAKAAVFVDPERIHELESVLKNLRMITHTLSDEDIRIGTGVAMVEAQCVHLHKQMLERFRVAVAVADMRSMQQFAGSLFDFDCGTQCVDVYLSEAFRHALPSKGVHEGLGADECLSRVRKFYRQVRERVCVVVVKCVR